MLSAASPAFEGATVDAYLHKTSKDLPAQVGVLFAVDGEGEAAATAAHDVAVHIAAMSPNYLSREDVPAELVESERRIAEETAKAEGKPEAAMTKIVEGRVTGFYKGEVLSTRHSPRMPRSPSRRSSKRPASRAPHSRASASVPSQTPVRH